MNQTNSTRITKPLTLEDLELVVRHIENHPAPTEWTLISPDGRIWKGDVNHMFNVVSANHPLMKIGGVA
jgi:hypothetical protein